MQHEIQQLQLIIENSRDFAIVLLNTERRITLWNVGAERLMGWNEAEIIGQPADIFFTPEDRAAGTPEQELRTARELGRAEDERWHIRKDGSRFYGSGLMQPVYESGVLQGYVKIFRDLTERERREANVAFFAELEDNFARLTSADTILQAVGEKLGAYLNLSHCLFAEIDEAQDRVRVIYVWKPTTTQDLVGTYRLSEFVSEKFQQAARAGETIVIYDTQTDPRIDAQAYAGFGIHSFITVPFHHGGQWKFLLTVNAADARNWRAEEIELFRELANRLFPRLERARTEEALRDSETRFRALADNIAQLAWMADATGWIFWYNRRWYEYTGTTPAQMEGWGWQSVHDPATLPQVMERWQASIASGEYFDMEFPLKGADGLFRPFLTRVHPIQDGAGNVTQWFGTNTDITEQRASEDSLRRHQAEIEELNARLARAMKETHHRVKNNLQVIAALLDLEESSGSNAHLGRIKQHTQALAMIHDILTAQTKDNALDTSHISVQTVLGRLIPMLDESSGNRHIRADVDEMLLPVQKSASLALLVNECVSNAMKHGANDIKITLRLCEQGPPDQERHTARLARLEVCDDGPGFPVGFDPRTAANTGLELIESAAKWDLRGDVRFENRKEGGARVIVTFPVAEDAVEPP